MSVYCSRCGAQNPDEAAFCFNCGARFLAVPAPPVVHSETPEKQLREEFPVPHDADEPAEDGISFEGATETSKQPSQDWRQPEFREQQYYAPPSAAPRPAEKAPTLEVASFGARVGAFIIDFIILRFVLFIALRVTDLDSEFQFKTPEEFNRFFDDYMSAVFSNDPTRIFSGAVGEFLQHSVTIAILTGAIFLAYYWIFYAMGGQTPGKFALGIRVCRVDGRPIGWGASLLRYIVYWLGSKVVYLGSLWGMFRPDVATWHDLAAGTRVYRIRTLEPAKQPPQVGS